MHNYLSKIKSHATIIIGNENVYNDLKQEIIDSNFLCLAFDYNAEDKDAKTLKLDDLEKIKNFLANKSSEVRYVVTNRNMRLTVLQNAMLKMLEEATETTKIIFVVGTISYFISTVLSRVQILDSNSELFANNNNLENKEDKEDRKTKTNQNIFSTYKKKLILAKDFYNLEKLLQIENLNSRGLISEKQLIDYLALI